jgi:hypothetical protein
LAASAAAISLLGWLMAAPGPVPAPQLASAPASDSPVTRVATNSSAGLNNTVVAGTHWDTLSPETVRRLNAYLVEHGEFSSMQGLSGVTSYARFVSNDD